MCHTKLIRFTTCTETFGLNGEREKQREICKFASCEFQPSQVEERGIVLWGTVALQGVRSVLTFGRIASKTKTPTHSLTHSSLNPNPFVLRIIISEAIQ